MRVPLPDSQGLLRDSAALGKQVAALLDMDATINGITYGMLRPELRQLARITHAEGGNLQPEEGHLNITVGWGHGGRNGIVMPGRGKSTKRDYTEEERESIAAGAVALGMPLNDVLTILGETTYDIHLNAIAFWSNVPRKVWEYTIGGYQVVKKWLSYREYVLLGRPLTSAEIREVTRIVRNIAALLLLESALDANYKQVSASYYFWPDKVMDVVPGWLTTSSC